MDVEGWLSVNSLSLIHYLNQFQCQNNISGNISEIGVYKGRFFIALCLLMRSPEKALAVDVFEDQHFNLDDSGQGDYLAFTENLNSKLGNWQGKIEIIKSDSLLVKSAEVIEAVGGQVRLFSVDGCHTAEHTESDLRLAADSLADGGVIILDDFENRDWPEVVAGTGKFLDKVKNMAPFAVGYNKLYLTDIQHHHAYQKFLENIVFEQVGYVGYIDVFGHKAIKALMPSPEMIFTHLFLQFIDFSSKASPEKYLQNGWFNPEPWGVWSDAENRADVDIPFYPSKNSKKIIMVVSFHAFVSELFSCREINIFIDNEKVDTVKYVFGASDYLNWKYEVPARLNSYDHLFRLSFELNGAKSPSELGLSEDQRKLGVGLRYISFSSDDSSSDKY